MLDNAQGEIRDGGELKAARKALAERIFRWTEGDPRLPTGILPPRPCPGASIRGSAEASSSWC